MYSIEAEEFKQRITSILMKADSNIKADDLYFSGKTIRGYYVDYMPKHPEITAADFIVHQDFDGKISVHGNMNALIPTIHHYKSIDDFERSMDG